jgi:hypothetical protein
LTFLLFTTIIILNMKQIKLGGKYANGQTTKVDDEDFELLSKYKWRLSGWGYAIRSTHDRTIFMHKSLMGTPPDEVRQQVDHINRDQLDNRKINLRFASWSDNLRNRDCGKKNKYRGVLHLKPWRAILKTNGKEYFIGTFNTAREAALAYNKKAIEILGDKAQLNNLGIVDS